MGWDSGMNSPVAIYFTLCPPSKRFWSILLTSEVSLRRGPPSWTSTHAKVPCGHPQTRPIGTFCLFIARLPSGNRHETRPLSPIVHSGMMGTIDDFRRGQAV
jgi:hypothetical protein